jgi:hypothetical protein
MYTYLIYLLSRPPPKGARDPTSSCVIALHRAPGQQREQNQVRGIV